MKLNWFSPLPPAKTGIAEYTASVLPFLRKYAEVVLWTDQTNWNSDIEKYARVRQYHCNNIPWLEINQADLNIYHIGNNPNFHKAIWQISLQCPGLVIIHDFRMQHFFTSLYGEQDGNRDDYTSHMKEYYGNEGQQAAESFWNGNLTTEYMAEYYPLTALALKNAVGAVTHTRAAFQSIKQENRWFVGYAPLPYTSKWEVETHCKKKEIAAPYRLIIFGYIGINRRLESTLEALSTLPEKKQFYLDIYGELWDTNYIQNQIEKLGISDLVTVHGFVEETTLDSALANADMAINLRYPTMGEASLTQLRIWNHALPSLVTQIGWYSEQPDNAVAFVRPENEIEDIQHYLRKFLANPEYFANMGKISQQILREKHSPEVYAQAIIRFAEKSQKFRTHTVAYELLENIGEELSSWINCESLDTQIRNIAEAIYFISG
jgi:glycosyltransferase involved in cell wall biosynthesis